MCTFCTPQCCPMIKQVVSLHVFRSGNSTFAGNFGKLHGWQTALDGKEKRGVSGTKRLHCCRFPMLPKKDSGSSNDLDLTCREVRRTLAMFEREAFDFLLLFMTGAVSLRVLPSPSLKNRTIKMEENTDHLNLMDTTTTELMKSHFEPEEKGTVRLKTFESCVHDVVKNVASTVPFDKFNKMVAGLQVFQERPTSAVQMYKMVKKNMETKCMNDLKDMIAEAELHTKFQELSQIIEQNSPYVGEKAWRPTGNPEDDHRSEVMVAKFKLVEDLEKKVLAKEAAVESLIAEVTTLREIAQSVDSTVSSLLSSTESRIKEETEKFKELEKLTETLRAEDHNEDQGNESL